MSGTQKGQPIDNTARSAETGTSQAVIPESDRSRISGTQKRQNIANTAKRAETAGRSRQEDSRRGSPIRSDRLYWLCFAFSGFRIFACGQIPE